MDTGDNNIVNKHANCVIHVFQVHHTGWPQTRDCPATPDGRHQCRLVALGRHQIQEERGVPGRHRIRQPSRTYRVSFTF